ncbi:hypothetical protein HDU96_004186 [Phlyctochytrium bullatum]|nr:hypothetical protein HDU96_004186 [Phlyctochytrium bullatum]
MHSYFEGLGGIKLKRSFGGVTACKIGDQKFFVSTSKHHPSIHLSVNSPPTLETMWTLAVALFQHLASLVYPPPPPGTEKKLAVHPMPVGAVPTGPLKISSLHIYPVKSCRGVKVDEAWVGPNGFEMDRWWMVIGAEDGKFLTQRQHPKMVLIQPRLEGDFSTPGGYARGGKLVLSAPGTDTEVAVPFRTSYDGTQPRSVAVWKDTVDGIDEGDEVAGWLTRVLGVPCRLLVKDPRTVRPIPERHTPVDLEFKAQTAFADSFPFLVSTEASIRDFNTRLDTAHKVQTLNFRPNITVDGPELVPFAEETWKKVVVRGEKGGETPLFISSRCTRCQVPTNCLETAVLRNEIMAAMMKFRRTDPGSRFEPCFGMNAIQGRLGVKIRVGDEVVVKEFTLDHNRKVGVWRV